MRLRLKVGLQELANEIVPQASERRPGGILDGPHLINI
jgi:hypothetical protein